MSHSGLSLPVWHFRIPFVVCGGCRPSITNGFSQFSHDTILAVSHTESRFAPVLLPEALWGGVVAQQVRCLLCKLEEPSSSPSTHIKHWSHLLTPVTPELLEAERARHPKSTSGLFMFMCVYPQASPPTHKKL